MRNTGLEEAQARIKIAGTSINNIRCANDTTLMPESKEELKSLVMCVDHNKLWKILREMRIPDHLTFLLRNLYAGQEQQLELDMEQQTGSK